MFGTFGAFLSDLSSAALFETWGAAGIAVLFLVSTFSCGLLVIPARIASPTLRALAGFPLLFLCIGTGGILIYLLGGTVRTGLYAFVVCSVLLVVLALWRGVFRELLQWKSLAVLSGLLAIAFVLMWFGWGETSDGVVRSMSGAWGDGPLHTLNAEAFVRRSPTSLLAKLRGAGGGDLGFPAFAGEQFHEPFGYDFIAAILRAAGFTVGAAFSLPAAGLPACLFGWLGLITMRLTSSLRGSEDDRSDTSVSSPRMRGPDSRFRGNDMMMYGIVGILLVSFGGLQWVEMASQTHAWTFTKFFGVHQPVWDKAEEIGLVWANHLNTFASQKHLLFGTAFLVVLATVLLDTVRTQEKRWWLFPLAVATGVLPLFHAHIFLAAGILWISAILLSRSRVLFLYAVLAALIATPVVIWEAALFTRSGFLSFAPGWMAGNGVFGWPIFWLRNLGVFLPLAVIAIVRGYRRDRMGTLLLVQPALILFLLANSIQFQPYQWDNFKIFLVVWILLLPLVVAEMSQWQFSSAGILRWSLVLLMSLTTLSEVVTHLHFRATYPVYTTADRAIGRELDSMLPKDAVVLARTDMNHNHPLTLTGRTLFAGYGGWLWTRNYEWEERAALVERLWRADAGILCSFVSCIGITQRVDDTYRV
ncbi:MAG: hypothetical protein G01um1014106_73, partial [Parcubacteria group bacterium Gr01-1014_106]